MRLHLDGNDGGGSRGQLAGDLDVVEHVDEPILDGPRPDAFTSKNYTKKEQFKMIFSFLIALIKTRAVIKAIVLAMFAFVGISILHSWGVVRGDFKEGSAWIFEWPLKFFH